MDILEGNKLINDFRGLKLGKAGYVNDYDTNWNTLMEACYQWDNLSRFNNDQTHELYIEFSDLLDDTVTRYEIYQAWRQLVANIQWYNSLNPQTP